MTVFLNESAKSKIKKLSPYIIGGTIGAIAGTELNQHPDFIPGVIDDLQYQAGKFFGDHPQLAFDYLPNSLLTDPDFLRGAASDYIPYDAINNAKETLVDLYNRGQEAVSSFFSSDNSNPENTPVQPEIPTAASQGLTADQVNQIVDPNRMYMQGMPQ